MKQLTLPLALAPLIILAACNTTPTPSVMSRDDAKNLKTIMPLAMNGLANSIRQGGSGVVTSGLQSSPGIATAFESPLAAQAAHAANLSPQAVSGNCGPATKPTDADGDKVPANFSYTYDCTVTVGTGFTFKANGVVSSKDANDNDPQSGYTTNGEIRYEFIFTNTTTGAVSSFSFIAR